MLLNKFKLKLHQIYLLVLTILYVIFIKHALFFLKEDWRIISIMKNVDQFYLPRKMKTHIVNSVTEYEKILNINR